MSSGSTDEKLIATYPFGPAGFAAAIVNLAVLEFVSLTAWSLVFFLALIVTVPLLLINAAVGFFMSRAGGTAARIGRGMLVACATTVISHVVVAMITGAVFVVAG